MINFEELDQLANFGNVLFHGSQKKVNNLIPNTPTGTSLNAHTECGVYATDIVLIAAFNAILDPSKMHPIRNRQKMFYSWYKYQSTWRFGVSPNVMRCNAFSDGFIYVVRRDSFQQLSPLEHEYISYMPVAPIAVIRFHKKCFFQKNNVVTLPAEYFRNQVAIL